MNDNIHRNIATHTDESWQEYFEEDWPVDSDVLDGYYQDEIDGWEYLGNGGAWRNIKPMDVA